MTPSTVFFFLSIFIKLNIIKQIYILGVYICTLVSGDLAVLWVLNNNNNNKSWYKKKF